MHHLAIMRKSWGLTQKIASGQKTIESRWYLNRSAPWDKIHTGDIVYFKDSGEPVTLQATVSKVLQFEGLTPAKVRQLLHEYGSQDGLTPDNIPHYYELFKKKRYCLLIFLQDVKPVEPFHIDKTGFGAMAAWITVSSVKHLRKAL